MSIGSGIAIVGVWGACAFICSAEPLMSFIPIFGAVVATAFIADAD